MKKNDTVARVTSIAERARGLRLTSVKVSEGMRTGSFRSCFRGHGIEFDGVREYERGDDVRSIDRNVTARSARPFVRLYREERELTVFLVVDDSRSMRAGIGGASRRDRALEAAALLAFAAERNASPVGSVVFDSAPGKSFPPRSGRDRVLAILSDLEHRESRGGGTALAGALAGASRVLRNRALVIVLSDFRSTGYETALGILSRKHDVVACRIVSPADLVLPDVGYASFRDPETGERESFPTASPSFRTRWEREGREAVHHWERACLRRGAAPLVLSTEDDAGAVLVRFFSARGERASWSTARDEATR